LQVWLLPTPLQLQRCQENVPGVRIVS